MVAHCCCCNVSVELHYRPLFARCGRATGFLRANPTSQRARRWIVCAEETTDPVISEDVLQRLRAAEAEAAALRSQLAAAKAAVAQEEGVAESANSVELRRGGTRIDSAGLRRETLFTSGSDRKNWLNESDVATAVDFLVGQGPSEAGGTAPTTAEQNAVVQRRLLLGVGATLALAALAFIPSSTFQSKPSKPLFLYLVPVLRTQELLKELESTVAEAHWDELPGALNRIQGSPNNIKQNLMDAAASLEDGAKRDQAAAIIRDIVEYLDQIDFNKYYEAFGRPGTRGGDKEAQFADFSQRAVKAAEGKLRDFLALMPRKEVEAAQQQLSASPF